MDQFESILSKNKQMDVAHSSICSSCVRRVAEDSDQVAYWWVLEWSSTGNIAVTCVCERSIYCAAAVSYQWLTNKQECVPESLQSFLCTYLSVCSIHFNAVCPGRKWVNNSPCSCSIDKDKISAGMQSSFEWRQKKREQSISIHHSIFIAYTGCPPWWIW